MEDTERRPVGIGRGMEDTERRPVEGLAEIGLRTLSGGIGRERWQIWNAAFMID
ncbi:unnamed protein product [Staurois parvus]|uniref:Uncharacterized protein n=1 Tax=Staurois parvus TaxID=386267 RepID=A0ABN9D6P2_9NEOB|nr:unnamed protein product [Staurois parvus]